MTFKIFLITFCEFDQNDDIGTALLSSGNPLLRTDIGRSTLCRFTLPTPPNSNPNPFCCQDVCLLKYRTLNLFWRQFQGLDRTLSCRYTRANCSPAYWRTRKEGQNSAARAKRTRKTLDTSLFARLVTILSLLKSRALFHRAFRGSSHKKSHTIATHQ